MTTIPEDGQLVRIGGHQLQVHIRPGHTGTTPLLLCGGIGTSYQALQPLVDAIDSSIEIIRVDVPGVGGSPPAPLPLGFPYLAWLLGQLLDDLGYRQVDVLGYSWGGGLAQQFAVQHRDRCRRLALISTSTGVVSVPGAPRIPATVPTLLQFVDPDSVVDLLYAGNSAVVRQILADTALCTGGPGLLHQLTAVAMWTSLLFLPLIGQDVLIMSGDDDPIVPVLNARILASLIPQARLHVFTGGHSEIIIRAADLAPIINRFLIGSNQTS